jgi:hypothetical protein
MSKITEVLFFLAIGMSSLSIACSIHMLILRTVVLAYLYIRSENIVYSMHLTSDWEYDFILFMQTDMCFSHLAPGVCKKKMKE